MEEFVEVGHTKKARGVAGELKMSVKDQYLDDFLEAKVLFLDLRGGKVPFFISSVKEGPDLLVKLDEVDDRKAAVELTGKPVYLRRQDLQLRQETALTPGYHFLEGFEIVTEKDGRVGTIGEIIEFPQQIMALVDYGGKEVMIPLNDRFITGIDEERRVLEMELPEGLLEL